jgi:hypothetical protein
MNTETNESRRKVFRKYLLLATPFYVSVILLVESNFALWAFFILLFLAIASKSEFKNVRTRSSIIFNLLVVQALAFGSLGAATISDDAHTAYVVVFLIALYFLVSRCRRQVTECLQATPPNFE